MLLVLMLHLLVLLLLRLLLCLPCQKRSSSEENPHQCVLPQFGMMAEIVTAACRMCESVLQISLPLALMMPLGGCRYIWPARRVLTLATKFQYID